MSGLSGLNKSAEDMAIGLVQFQLPTVQTPADLKRTLHSVCEATRAASGPTRRSTSWSSPSTACTG